MFYTVEYTPGMVRGVLAQLRRGALETGTFDLRPGPFPLSIVIVRPQMRTLTVRVHPEYGLLSLHDGVDDTDATLLRMDPDHAALLRDAARAQKDGSRTFYVDFDRIVMRRRYVSPVPELHCAADIPWKVLDPRSRRMLVSNRKFADYDADKFPVEHAVLKDDAVALAKLTLPDPQETLLFASMAASEKCVRHLVERTKVTKDMFDALVATSLKRAGAAQCALHMVSSSGGELPSADAVQKMARGLSPSAFREIYNAMMVRQEWGWT